MRGMAVQSGRSDAHLIQQLAGAAKISGWPFATYEMQASDVLVVDGETRKLIEDHKPATGPSLLAPEELKMEAVPDGGRVFVLMRQGERAFVRSLKKQAPEQTIVSVTYDDAVDVASLGKFPGNRRLYILAGSDASGTHELTNLLSVNSVMQSVPVFDAVSDAWSQWCRDFEFVRHVIRILGNTETEAQPRHLYLGISLEQLERLRASGIFSLETLKRFIVKYGIKCIYFLNRNKLHVAALQYLKGENGVFSTEQIELADKTAAQPSSAKLREIVLNILANEVRFERFLEDVASVRVIASDDVRGNPAAVVNMLTAFMETGILRQIKIPEHEKSKALSTWVSGMAKAYREDMHEMLGVEINELGSYQPSTFPADQEA